MKDVRAIASTLDKPFCSAAASPPFHKLLSDVLGDAMTVAAILTEAAEL